jgi:hypothetical protein
LPLDIGREFLLLAFERPRAGLDLTPAPVVLGQRNDPGEVGFREPLDLLAQRCPATAQVGAARLQLLRQPVPAARPLHRVRDHSRGREHLAQVAPDQLLQRSGGDVAGRATVARREDPHLRLGAAQVVVVPGRQVAAAAAASAAAAAHQTTQEVLVHPVVPPGHLPVVAQWLLHAVELVLADDGRDPRDRDPFGRVRDPLGASAAADGEQGGAARLGGPRAQAVAEHLAEIDRVGQHTA